LFGAPLFLNTIFCIPYDRSDAPPLARHGQSDTCNRARSHLLLRGVLGQDGVVQMTVKPVAGRNPNASHFPAASLMQSNCPARRAAPNRATIYGRRGGYLMQEE
jgi:hypothetical protein